MSSVKMHVDEIEIGIGLVKRIVAEQFPGWADLPLKKVMSSGTNNALFKLGDGMVVRLPRISSAVKHINTERTWLPKLAPHLPVSVPLPLGLGYPSKGYPWPWTIYTWLEGLNPDVDLLTEPELLASDIAQFITDMHRIDPTDAPPARRGAPLEVQDPQVRQALKDLHDVIDIAAATRIWEECLQVPAWAQPPIWVHGDLMHGNLLVTEGRLSGVIDFEGVGIGDPACDLIPAWNLLPVSARDTFKITSNVDNDTWLRGKGWAFSMALIQLPYYKNTNLILAANADHVIKEVLADSSLYW